MLLLVAESTLLLFAESKVASFRGDLLLGAESSLLLSLRLAENGLPILPLLSMAESSSLSRLCRYMLTAGETMPLLCLSLTLGVIFKRERLAASSTSLFSFLNFSMLDRVRLLVVLPTLAGTMQGDAWPLPSFSSTFTEDASFPSLNVGTLGPALSGSYGPSVSPSASRTIASMIAFSTCSSLRARILSSASWYIFMSLKWMLLSTMMGNWHPMRR
mmetsp:Transcript_38419/g.89648  ORF Transcript_38419/g.89648 Transcript_38419/m.89648 type:complete len:216 (-) Transcript_38419:898-1545(-)